MSKDKNGKDFLEWAKAQGGECCVCRWVRGAFVPGCDLHHIGGSGMGRKGSDYKVARVCKPCHKAVQGKFWKQFERAQNLQTWAALNQDALSLLDGWERSKPAGDTYRQGVGDAARLVSDMALKAATDDTIDFADALNDALCELLAGGSDEPEQGEMF